VEPLCKAYALISEMQGLFYCLTESEQMDTAVKNYTGFNNYHTQMNQDNNNEKNNYSNA